MMGGVGAMTEAMNGGQNSAGMLTANPMNLSEGIQSQLPGDMTFLQQGGGGGLANGLAAGLPAQGLPQGFALQGSASSGQNMNNHGGGWGTNGSRADSILAAAISASNNSGMSNFDLLANSHRPGMNGAMQNTSIAGVQHAQQGGQLLGNAWMGGTSAAQNAGSGLNLGVQTNSLNNMYNTQEQTWNKTTSLPSMGQGGSDFNRDMQNLLRTMSSGVPNGNAAELHLQQPQGLLQSGHSPLLGGVGGVQQASLGNPLAGNSMSTQDMMQQGNFGPRMFSESPLPTDADSVQAPVRRSKKKRAKTFPEKLMDALVQYGSDSAIAWLPDNKSFVVVSARVFVDTVLNRVFKEAKYASFVRKLHRWGFVRLTSGTGTDCFHHPMFQRGRRDLASRISCTPRDKDGKLTASSYQGRGSKPPSLAGVERFIRARVAEASSMATGHSGVEGSFLVTSQTDSHTGISAADLGRASTPTPVSVDDDPFGPDAGDDLGVHPSETSMPEHIGAVVEAGDLGDESLVEL